MKDRLLIVTVIVAIHIIVISMFIFTGDDNTEQLKGSEFDDNSPDTTSDLVPQTTQIDEQNNTPEQQRDQLFSDLTSSETSGQSYIVESGDSLMVISKKFYGSSKHYNYIFEANKDTMKSASSVRIGQKLIIPPAP